MKNVIEQLNIIISNNVYFQPLDQFDLYCISSWVGINIFGFFLKNFFIFLFFYEITFFNLLLYLIFLCFGGILITLPIIFEQLKLLSLTLWQYFYEICMFKFILMILKSQVSRRGEFFLIYLVTVFYFILFANLIGLIPFSFTITSHITLTFMLGASTIIGLTILGFYIQKYHFSFCF